MFVQVESSRIRDSLVSFGDLTSQAGNRPQKAAARAKHGRETDNQ